MNLNENLEDIGNAVKTRDEIEKLKNAAILTQKTMDYIVGELKPGISENYLKGKIIEKMKELETCPSFEIIVASGENSANPHAVPTDRVLCRGDFVKIDIGCVYKGYAGDMTRTFVLGKASDKQKNIYETVKNAQIAGIAMAKDGIICKEADKAARDIICSAGYRDNFIHGLGHGIGREVHEYPRINQSSEVVLKNNMVVTIEPGIYISGLGGVRIEDTLVIGGDNFFDFTKELLVI